jgi:ATP adenylyltransferase/5',5'''-P-1,P-4-tetraphosphate phosphorylase II
MEKKGQYSERVRQLFVNQNHNWLLMNRNYDDLKQVRFKILEFSNFHLKIQFNPTRIISSSAKVDKHSIDKRPCFLCPGNRPAEQDQIVFEDVFHILVNPYPIFPLHLTIAIQDHLPQLIKANFSWMLKLAKALPDFTLFYNGPRCGASAPDHMHFQAGNRNYMPIDYQLDGLKSHFGKEKLVGNCKVTKINDLVRKFILLESADMKELESVFDSLYERLLILKPSDVEPDMNVHCSYDLSGWRVLIFPRGAHRPRQFYAEGEEQVLFSPASVDLGGLLIMPIEKDFEKTDKVLAWSMMKQIGPDDAWFNEI